MRLPLLLAASLVLFVSAQAEAMTLASEGTTKVVIVTPARAFTLGPRERPENCKPSCTRSRAPSSRA